MEDKNSTLLPVQPTQLTFARRKLLVLVLASRTFQEPVDPRNFLVTVNKLDITFRVYLMRRFMNNWCIGEQQDQFSCILNEFQDYLKNQETSALLFMRMQTMLTCE